MQYMATGRDIVTAIGLMYDKYGFIADQFIGNETFPFLLLDQWKKTGLVASSVTEEMFSYCNSSGKKVVYNSFIFNRIRFVIERGSKDSEEFIADALEAPLLYPNKNAIRVTGRNMKSYLMAIGGSELMEHYDAILKLTIEYHNYSLMAWVCDEEVKRASGEQIPKKVVNNWRSFASELYHRVPGGFDWEALSHFIIHETTAQGQGYTILQQHGPQRGVYKTPLQGSCDACKRLYLEEDGTPKVFDISELLANGSLSIPDRVSDQEAADVPTCGPSHLYCTCLGPSAYTGYEPWVKKPNLIRRKDQEESPDPAPAEAKKPQHSLVRKLLNIFRG